MKFRPAATSAFSSDSAAAKKRTNGEDDERKGTSVDDDDAECLADPSLRRHLVYPSAPAVARYGPIVWRLESHRHYNFLRHIPYWDVAWEDKHNSAVWRGGLTGFDHRELDKLTAEERGRLSDGDICRTYSERCRLVLSTSGSDLVDAGLTFLAPQGDDGYTLPDAADGVSLLKPSLSIPELLRHKILISLQGNDVASGLKWSLFSRSVVLMPPPTVNSWAMEERLIPWVHYVPLSSSSSSSGGIDDVEDMVRWVIENEERARTIAERATLWIWDMFFHEDAAEDEVKTKEEILRRYGRYFRPAKGGS